MGVVLWAVRWTANARHLPPLPPRAFVAFGLLYLAAAVLATIFSIRPSTSVPYVAAIAIVVIVSLWLGPWLLLRPAIGTSFLALLATAGVAATLVGLILSLTGPVLWFDRWLGVYLAQELTLFGKPTGIIVLRIAGPFLAPGGQSLVLAAAMLAVLALRPRLAGHGRTVATIGLVVVVVGLILTFSRVGWLGAIAGSAVLAVAPLRSRQLDLPSGLACIVLTIVFVGFLGNAWGTDYRPDLTEARNATAAAGFHGGVIGETQGDSVPEIVTPEVSGGATGDGTAPQLVVRGGSELSGRLELWSASVRAIADSPLTGYGPGTNAFALDPYLSGESRRLVGLTSHNTWLRTWVEFGIFGLIGLLGIALTTLFVVAKRFATNWRATPMQLGMLAIFVGLGVAQAVETFLLGGVSLWSFVWSIAAGVLVLDSRVNDPARL